MSMLSHEDALISFGTVWFIKGNANLIIIDLVAGKDRGLSILETVNPNS